MRRLALALAAIAVLSLAGCVVEPYPYGGGWHEGWHHDHWHGRWGE